MAIFRQNILTILGFVGIIIGFVCINYTIPLFPTLMRWIFPLNTLVLWMSLCLFYWAGLKIQKAKLPTSLRIYIPLVLILIALKVTIPTHFFLFSFKGDTSWFIVFKNSFHWVWKAIIPIFIYIIWWKYFRNSPIQSISKKQLILIIGFIVIFIPIVFYLKDQSSFHYTYPKLKAIDSLKNTHGYWKYAFVYELFYLIDFVTIEVLFRGLMIQVLLRNRNVIQYILPMALVYGMIHYGKPLLECISSFFGGAILGYLTYKTNEIYIGIFIHLFIAIMMELVMFI